MIFDSVYNPFRGIETKCREINGKIKKNQHIKFMAKGKTYYAEEVGTLRLKQFPREEISAGDVGYLITGIKEAREAKGGDTITDADNPTQNMVAGFEDVNQWNLLEFILLTPTITKSYETLWRSFSLTMLRLFIHQKVQQHLALASAVVS